MEEIIGGHLGFDHFSYVRGWRTLFSASLVAPGRKPSGDLVRLGEYPSPLGEFIQDSQESLAVAFKFSSEGRCSATEYLGGQPSISAIWLYQHVNPRLPIIIKAEIILFLLLLSLILLSCNTYLLNVTWQSFLSKVFMS